MKNWILALVLGLCGGMASADGLSMTGCTDKAGKPVAAVADESLKVVAQYALADGKAVIRFNPSALPRLLPETRLFVFAHECGRQYLAQPVEGERTAEQVQAADCWALDTLRRSKIIAGKDGVEAISEDLNLSTDDWSWLPGAPRALKAEACTGARVAKGSLNLPTGAPRQKWDVCQQACGAKLFSCGRSATCDAAFTECSSACGK